MDVNLLDVVFQICKVLDRLRLDRNDFIFLVLSSGDCRPSASDWLHSLKPVKEKLSSKLLRTMPITIGLRARSQACTKQDMLCKRLTDNWLSNEEAVFFDYY